MANTIEMEKVATIEAIATSKSRSQLDASSVYEVLIQQALTDEGAINQCYSLFHDYSFSNTLLAYFQMKAQKVDITPIGTYKKWQSLGKHVKRGAKALTILYPVFSSFWKDEEVENPDGSITKKRIKIKYISGFEVHHEHFALSQCREYGKEQPQKVDLKIDWQRVLKELNITQVKWDSVEGNAQGYARPKARELAINPLCQVVDKTMVHEIAHCLLHGNDEEFKDNEVLERNIKEVQAELTAYLVMSMLGCNNQEVLKFSRGYIQGWLRDSKLEPSETKAVMRATNKILEVIANKPKKEYNKRG